MGEKTISTQVKINGDITPDFSRDWEVEFQGEKYIMPLRQPQGAKENTSLNSTIGLTFQHWAIYQLKRWTFVTMQPIDTGTAVADEEVAPVQLNLKDFCDLFGQVLRYYYGDTITIDLNSAWQYDNAPTAIEISHSYIWNVLIDAFHGKYGVRWAIEPREDNDNTVKGGERYVIKIGYPTTEVDHIFEYGFEGGLLKLERQVQSEDIRNMIKGRGGEKNIPKYYFKKSPDEEKWRSDPDWIEELANIYFTNLMPATFRSYIQGWKAAHISKYPGYKAVGENNAYSPWAYRKGFADAKFRPVEFVADEITINPQEGDRQVQIYPDYAPFVKKGSSIDVYGPLLAPLDNNDDIYPTLQGTGLDIAVAVEQIESDDVEEATDNDATLSNVGSARGTARNVAKSAYKTLTIRGANFTVPTGKTANFIDDAKILSVVISGSGGGRGTHSRPQDIATSAELTSKTINIYNAVTGAKKSASGIPAGSWYYEIVAEVHNLTTDKTLNITVGTESPKLQDATLGNDSWKNTFDIWVKNIWETSKLSTETNEEYAERVWKPILGDREQNTAKVMFTTGALAISEDYEFTIVDFPKLDTSKSFGGESSHWRIKLAKSDADLESTGLYVPSTQRQGKAGDKFVFIGTEMTHHYVVWAETALDDWKKDQLREKKDIKPTWVVTTDRVRLNNGGKANALIQKLRIGNSLRLADKRFIDGDYETLYLQSITYTYREPSSDDAALNPDVAIVLSNEYATTANPVATMQGEISALQRQIGSISNIEQIVRAVGDRLYLRKSGIPDRSLSPTQFFSLLTSGDFRAGLIGGAGWGFFKDENGNWVLEADRVNVRQEMQVNTLVINQAEGRGGMEIDTAAFMEVTRVVETSDGYACYFDQKEGSVANLFHIDDVAYCNRWTPENTELKFYKRRVTAVGVDNITLSKTDVNGSGIPAEKDNIIHFGNYTDKRRQYVKVRDVVGGGYERYIENLDSVNAKGVEYYFVGKQAGESRWFVGNKDLVPYSGKGDGSYIEFKGRKFNLNNVRLSLTSSVGDKTINDFVSDAAKAEADKAKAELQANIDILQNQVDGVIESFNGFGAPTLTNYPANEWTADAERSRHDRDIYTDITPYVDNATTPTSGQSWKWYYNSPTDYGWVKIADSDAVKALQLATMSVRDTDVLYISHTSPLQQNAPALPVVNPDGIITDSKGWQTKAPDWQEGRYIWQTTYVRRGDGSASFSDPTCIQGANGKSVSVTSTEVRYSTVHTATQPADATFTLADVPSLAAGQYLWSRTRVGYDNGDSTTTYAVSRLGENGADGTAWGNGKMLFNDPTFKKGSNKVFPYKHPSPGTLTVTRIDDAAAPNDSGKVMRIRSIGELKPGLGGFYQVTQARASATFIQRFVARIPVGYTLAFGYNIGTSANGAKVEWLTSNAGTGKWEEYMLKFRIADIPDNGSQTVFGTFGHIYLTGPVYGTEEAPVDWYLAYATTFDMDANGEFLIESQSVTYAKTTVATQPADSAFIYTSLGAAGVGPGDYLWCKTEVKYSDGTVVKSYSVSRIGSDGEQGTPGSAGADGRTPYVHHAYANSADGTAGFSTTYFMGALYVGVCTDYDLPDPTTPSSYEWARLKGEDGISAKTVTVNSDAQVFTYENDFASLTGPSKITLTASVQGIGNPVYHWSYKQAGQTAFTELGDRTPTIELTPAGAVIGQSRSVTVRCTVDGVYDEVTIIKVSSGANAAPARSVRIAGEQVFTYEDDFATLVGPGSITLAATLQGTTGYQWSYKTPTQSAFTNISGATAATYALGHNASIWGTAKSITLRCTSGNVYDEVTIAKVSSGSNGTNGSSTIAFQTTYNVPLSQWESWLGSTNEYNGWNVDALHGAKVGDTAIIQARINDIGTDCYFIGTITRIDSSTRICVRTPLPLYYGKPGADGAAGADAYTVLLTNESHTFEGDTEKALPAATDCGVLVFKGNQRVAATIGSITGAPAGMSVSGIVQPTATAPGAFKVNVTGTLTQRQGTLTVPVTVDGTRFDRVFSWSLSLQGTDGASYTENLLCETGKTVENSNYLIAKYDLAEAPAVGEPMTITIWGELAATKNAFVAYSSDGSVPLATLQKVSEGVYHRQFTCKNAAGATSRYVNIYTFNSEQSGVSRIDRIKLERGHNSAPAWTPAPTDSDAYSIILTNESHIFEGDSEKAVSGSASSEIIAYKGATQVAATIGTISGMPAGMSVSKTGDGTVNAGFTVSVTPVMKTRQGVLTVPVTVDGKQFIRKFSWSLSLRGKNGRGIVSVNEMFAVNNSSTTPPADSAFSPSIPSTTPTNRYLWNYELTTYTDNTSEATEKHVVAVHGENGADGASITDVESFYLASDKSTGITQASAGWTTDASAIAATMTGLKPYLWNYEKVTFSKGAPKTTTPHVVGRMGRGILTIEEEYYLSTSPDSLLGGTWKPEDNKPAWEAGKYMWTRTKITYTDNSVEYIGEVCVTGTPGTSVLAEYSADGSNWHPAFTTGDLWMRTSADGGKTWSDGMRLTGPGYAPNLLTGTDPDTWKDISVSQYEGTVIGLYKTLESVGLSPGDTMTVSVDVKSLSAKGLRVYVAINDAGSTRLGNFFGNDIAAGTRGRSSVTITIPQNAAKFGIYISNANLATVTETTTEKYRALKVCKGTDATWSPAASEMVGTDGKWRKFQWAKSTDALNEPTGGWSDTPMTAPPGEYVWMRSGLVVPPATVPAKWDKAVRLTGDTGAAGSDVYRLDIDNEVAAVACNAAGTPISYPPPANASVYKGGTRLTSGVSYSIPQTSGIFADISDKGAITLRGMEADTAEITVQARVGSVTLTTIMSVYKVRPGTDGSPAVIYKLMPSVNNITIDANGHLSTNAVSCKVYRTTGANTPVLTGERQLKYQRIGIDSYEHPVTLTNGTSPAIAVTEEVEAVVFTLYDGSTMLDRERIFVIADARGLAIGGENLLRNSDFIDGSLHWRTYPADSGCVDFNAGAAYDHLGRKSAHFHISGAQQNTWGTVLQYFDGYTPGEVHMFSGYVYTDNLAGIDGWWQLNAVTDSADFKEVTIATKDVLVEGKWVFISGKVYIPTDATTVGIAAKVQRNGSFYINSWKVERGNKATAWSASAKDTGYLRQALGQDTDVVGGVILSSLIQARDVDGDVTAGINGIANSGRSIAIWGGGPLRDAAYESDGAAFALRHDGSVYAAHNTVRFEERRMEVGDNLILDYEGLKMFGSDGQTHLRIADTPVSDYLLSAASINPVSVSKPLAATLVKHTTAQGAVSTAWTFGLTAPNSLELKGLQKGMRIELAVKAEITSAAPAQPLTGNLVAAVVDDTTNTAITTVTAPVRGTAASATSTAIVNTTVPAAGTYRVEWWLAGDGKGGGEVLVPTVRTTVKGRTATGDTDLVVIGNNGLLAKFGLTRFCVRERGITMETENYGLRVTENGVEAKGASGNWHPL